MRICHWDKDTKTSMAETTNKAELALQHVLESLEVYKGAKAQGEPVSSGSVAQAAVVRKGTVYQVVVSGLPGGNGCLVSVWEGGDTSSIATSLLDYSRDLKLADNVRFPVSYKEYGGANDTSQACSNVYKALNRQGVMRVGPAPTATVSTPSTAAIHPPDMPQFDDEYEVNAAGASALPDRYPGLNLPEKHARPLGNPDLHPGGQADPFHFGEANVQGGMVLDPFGHQQNRSNMQGSARDMRQRGPGWMPGSKWDDPFGPGGSSFPGSFQ